MQGLVDLFELKRSRHLLMLGAGIGLPATEGGANSLLPEMGAEDITFFGSRGVARQGAMEEGETNGEQGA